MALLVAGAANVYGRHREDVERYAVRSVPVPTMGMAEWAAGGWRSLPAYRTDITGEVEEPLLVQWVGDTALLRDRLIRAGWRDPAPWSLAGSLDWLSATADAAALPVMPRAQAGRLPGLTLVRKAAGSEGNRRLVLRLWRADLRVGDAAALPLWIGSAVEERIWQPLSLANIPLQQEDSIRPLAILASALPSGRLVSRGLSAAGWDGGVLLVTAPGE